MNQINNKMPIFLIFCLFLLTGCDTSKTTIEQTLNVEDNQVKIPISDTNITDVPYEEDSFNDSLGPKEYISDYFTLSYPADSIEVNEWDMDDSTTLKLNISNSKDYINVHYASDYSYADYCNALSDSLSNMEEYFGSNAQIGTDKLNARCFEYKPTIDYRITFYLTPAKNGVLIVEVGNSTNSHGENLTNDKSVIKEILDSVTINEDYIPSEYDYTATKIIESPPSTTIGEY